MSGPAPGGAALRRPPEPAFLVVDKPVGATSHDLVSWARRALGTREIGHTGTLDPFATGVLVLCIGEATKLASYVMAGDKEYEAVLRLGDETDTLDATGAVVRSAPIPALDVARVTAAAASFIGRTTQVPPAYSAIKEDGVRLHQLARRGEVVTPKPRAVVCHALEVRSVAGADITFRLECAAGYYVRSLGRDLAVALGTVGHLTTLRRTRSGRHLASAALPGDVLRLARTDEAARARVHAALSPLTPASSPLPVLFVDAASAVDLASGKRPLAPPAAEDGLSLAFGEDGLPRAVVELVRADAEPLRLRVVRGFAPRAPAS